MKPPEILAMIEEAAGTRMYEAKKQQAEKTIEKKDQKLKEINDILAEEINPTLTKLKEERSAYLEYQKIQRELEHLTKLYIAYKFVCAEEASTKSKEDLESLKKKLDEIQDSINQNEAEVAEIDVAIEELERARDNVIGGQVAEKETALRDVEKREAKASSAMKTLEDNVKQEDKKRKQIQKGLNDDEKALAGKKNSLSGMQELFDKLREEDEKCKADLEAAQAKYQALQLGEEVIEGGKTATLQEQIMSTKQDISAAETKVKAADTKLKHNTEQCKRKQTEMKKTEAEYKRDSVDVSKFEKEITAATAKLESMNYEEGAVEQLEQEVREVRHQANAKKSKMEGLDARYPNLVFNYRYVLCS